MDALALDTPCPPLFALPTHAKTLVFSTDSYVRKDYNDWYQCIEGPYCNTPNYWGYNPPGEGSRWEEAWRKLDEPYPCNAALAESSEGANDAVFGGNNSPDFVSTKRPTSEPTRLQDRPSQISGVVWYDANGDGYANTVQNAVTQSDYDAAQNEKGAGVSNMKVTLRECNSDRLLGVAYTFPMAFGVGGSGSVEVVDISYIEAIEKQQQDLESIGGNFANDGLGIGNTEGRLGFYSFRVLPFQIPGQFYVVFESPEGYRLSGGSGDYWEVYESVLYDDVQPMVDAPWRDNANTANRQRRLQQDHNNATIESAEDEHHTADIIEVPTIFDPTNIPKGPINYSGYYAKSRCISLTQSPSKVTTVHAGLTKDSWPLIPHQYASFVVTIQFFAPTIGRNRNRDRRKLQVDSLECRKYQKLKSEGVEIEDIWGCEQGPTNVAMWSSDDFKELTLEEGDEVATSVRNFLHSRIPRAWTIKFVSLAHQEMMVLVKDEEDVGRVRRLLNSMYSLFQGDNDYDGRELQGNKMIAKLELGFRLRAEYNMDRSGTDLAKVILDSLSFGADSFLTAVKGSIPVYFRLAGGVEVRDILWTPEKEAEKLQKEQEKENEDTVIEEEIPMADDDIFGSFYDDTPEPEPEIAKDETMILGMPMLMFIGIVVGTVAFILIFLGLFMFLHYRRRADRKSKKKKKKQKMKPKGAAKKIINSYDDSESSFDYLDEDSFDDLSSRFFSDSSKYDPEARRRELDAFKEIRGTRQLEQYSSSEGDSYETSSRYSESYYSQSDDGSYASYETDGSRSYSYASNTGSGHNPRASMRSSATSGRSSRKSRNNHRGGSMRSSGRSGRTSMRSSGISSGQFSSSDMYSEYSEESKMSKISEDYSDEDYGTSRGSYA